MARLPIRRSAPLLALALALAAGIQAQVATPIGELLVDADGDTLIDRIGDRVTIRATVTVAAYPALRLDDREYRIAVQDSTGGLRVVSPREDKLKALVPGVEVRLRGTLGQYHGCPFLSAQKILEILPADDVEPRDIELATLDGERENGRLVRIRGELTYDLSRRHYLIQSGDKEVRLFLRPPQAYVPVIAKIEDGCHVDVTGIVEQYDRTKPYTVGYRIRPRHLGDVILRPPTLLGSLGYGLAAAGLGLVVLLSWLVRRRRSQREATTSLSSRQAQRMHALGTLAGGIAHEFNNYLMAIMGFAELARQDVPEHSSARDNLDEVIEAGNRAKALIEQILDFSRDEDTFIEPVCAFTAFHDGMRLLRAVLPSSITVDEDFDESIGRIVADRGQINQMLINLGTNAANAMPEGGKLTVRLQRVAISEDEMADLGLASPGEHALLEVTDTGVGMDEETLAHIYDPFFSARGQAQGTGLGLSVVHGIVSRCDGAIQARSTPGSGSTFQVYLPLTTATVHSAAASEARSDVASPGGHVLLVDDQENLARLGARLFRVLGFEATELTDAQEALAAIEADPGRFDLVVTDLTMPNITGLELSRRIHAIRPDLPVLLMTGNIDAVSDDEREDAGIDAVLLKPFRLDDLRQRVSEAVGS